MISVLCNSDDCPNTGIVYNLLGESRPVECGGCRTALEPYDERPDPAQPVFPANA
jgi:hypothetical protein